MTEKWFKNFGWNDNPFKIRPDSENLIGFLDIRSKVLSYLHAESPLLILGPTGTGKTTLLQWLKKQKDAVYINSLDYDEKKFKKQISGLRRKLKKLLGSKNIVLIDEAHAMPLEFSEWLRAKFDSGEIDSLIMAAVHDEMNFSPAFIDRIGARKIEMRKITEEEAFKMVKQRIFAHGDEIPFTNNALKYIFKLSDYHPRKILENCEKCCIHASWSGLRYIDEEFVKKVLEPIKPKQTKLPSKNLSPIQQKILDLLSNQNLTTQEIAQKLNISRASAAKQISRLMLRTDGELMKKKGITSPLVEPKNKGRPVVYGLKE